VADTTPVALLSACVSSVTAGPRDTASGDCLPKAADLDAASPPLLPGLLPPPEVMLSPLLSAARLSAAAIPAEGEPMSATALVLAAGAFAGVDELADEPPKRALPPSFLPPIYGAVTVMVAVAVVVVVAMVVALELVAVVDVAADEALAGAAACASAYMTFPGR